MVTQAELDPLVGGEIEVIGPGATYMFSGIISRALYCPGDGAPEVSIGIRHIAIYRQPVWELRGRYPSHPLAIQDNNIERLPGGILKFTQVGRHGEVVTLRPPGKAMRTDHIHDLWVAEQTRIQKIKTDARIKAAA